MTFPLMVPVAQRFPRPIVTDLTGTVCSEVRRGIAATPMSPGQSVAIAVGSRGISNIVEIVRDVVAVLTAADLRPFIVPAMGSHGGATADGQRAVLTHYGITPECVGAEIRSDMSTLSLGCTDDDIDVRIDRNALTADHIIAINRIKPHTSFNGRIESGIMKMLAVGLGKRDGASAYHRAAFSLGFERVISTVCHHLVANAPIAFGIAIIENAYDETAMVKMIPAAELDDVEPRLLQQCKQWQARLPVDSLDILIVDQMGKNISGTGMDSNVIGRGLHVTGSASPSPTITRIVVRDLTPESHGNALGIGLADFTTTRLVSMIDSATTYTNGLTAMAPAKARIPIHFSTDREALEAAFATIGTIAPEHANVVRVESTLRLTKLLVSESLFHTLSEREDITPLGPPVEMVFTSGNNLPPLSNEHDQSSSSPDTIE